MIKLIISWLWIIQKGVTWSGKSFKGIWPFLTLERFTWGKFSHASFEDGEYHVARTQEQPVEAEINHQATVSKKAGTSVLQPQILDSANHDVSLKEDLVFR